MTRGALTEVTGHEMAANLKQPFYVRNQGSLKRFFEIAGVVVDTHDLSAMVEATQPWTKGDHVRPEHRLEIASTHTAEAHQLYADFGLKTEQQLPIDDYDQILVLGGMHVGNNRRVGMARDALDTSTTERLVLLGGERPVYFERETELIKSNIKTLIERNDGDRWVAALKEGEASIDWESDMLRLAASVQLGYMGLVATTQYDNERQAYPEQTHMIWREQGVLTTLLHTKAVVRPNGDRRHTTEACIDHWVKAIPPAKGAKVGFVTANPHIERTARVTAKALARAGREDIELVAAGTAAIDTQDHAIFAGEIARNLYEDITP